jgi:4-pyridoxate dehydrogenase
MTEASASFDYVIVGAGSAGCTLANRLSADAGVRVLLLEAGGWNRHPFVKLPLGWGKVLLNRIYDWGYDGEPQESMAGRRIECARGKVVGGSSTINAMAYVRGNRGDYARWTSYGLRGWSYDEVLPYFRRQENWEGGASHYRGAGGPLATRKSRYQDPLVDTYLEAAAASGHKLNDDYNAERQDGFARMQMTIRRGRRESAATAYLHPVLTRKNLTVVVRAQATRVVFNGSRAVGVEYVENGQRRTAHADREVIVSAGSINSPQILMLSGIGEPDALAAHGIKVTAALPGVGENLQDHAAALLIYGRGDKSPLVSNTPTGVSTPRWRRSAPWLVSEPSLWARCKPKIVRSWPSPCKWSVPALHCRSDQLSRSILIRARLNHGLHISGDIWRPDSRSVGRPVSLLRPSRDMRYSGRASSSIAEHLSVMRATV